MALPALSHPERLWWLLALPVLWWLALPPRPKRSLFTAHLAQWLQALRAAGRRPVRFRRLRFVLLAVAFVAGAAAFAEPVLPGAPGPSRLVVLLDGSASMAAQEADGTTAWANATALLRERLAGVPQGVDVTLLRCGADLQRRHGASARAAVDLAPPAGAPAVVLADVAATVTDPDQAVWTLTDAQGERSVPDGGALTVLGGKRPNAAILAVRVTDRWPLPSLSLEVDLRACADGDTALALAASGAVAAANVDLRVGPGERRTVPLELVRTPEGGLLELRLSFAGDAQPEDDAWAATLPPLPAPRIAVLDEDGGGPALRAAAKALAAEVAGEVVPAGEGEPAGFLLVEGGVVDTAPGRARAVYFGCRDPAAGDTAPLVWPRPALVDWNRTDALTAGLDLSELHVEHALRNALPPGEPLLWGAVPGGAPEPLAVVCRGERAASLHFAFRLQDSGLPLLPAFPQLLRRAFVAAHGAAAAITVHDADRDALECDLRRRTPAQDRPLPAFAGPERSLAAAFALAAVLALALRAFVR